MITSTNPLVDKLRTIADRMDSEIKNKLGPRQENTPKRQREAASARWEGRCLERTQQALRALATAHEQGNLPSILASVKTKSQVLDMMRTRCDTSGGYYSFIDTGEFSDQGPVATALRDLVASQASAEELAAQAERRRLEHIRELEGKVRNVKIDGFFPTPSSVAKQMFAVSSYNDGGLVLEPSAGAGHLADAIKAHYPDSSVICCECQFSLVEILEAKGHSVLRGDFLDQQPEPIFDAVFMNPPFERLADTEHIRHAFEFLKPGCELISVAAMSFTFNKNRKAEEFCQWLDEVGEYAPLPEGAFKGADAFRETGVNTCLVRALKPR